MFTLSGTNRLILRGIVPTLNEDETQAQDVAATLTVMSDEEDNFLVSQIYATWAFLLQQGYVVSTTSAINTFLTRY